MATSLQVAQRSDAPLLENLFQFYRYDFAELIGGDVGHDGRFSLPPLSAYWQDSWRHPHIVRVDGQIAGFAFVQQRSRITQASDVWDVAEFFVMRRYRRQGVGSDAALHLFEQFRGRWEVRQIHANLAATKFWRTVIARHTGGRYSERVYDDERWRGPVQSFDNTALD